MNTDRQTLGLFWRHAKQYPKYLIILLLAVPTTLLVQQFLPPLIIAGVLDRLSSGDFIPGDLWNSFGKDLIIYAVLVIASNALAWRAIIILVWRLEIKVQRDIIHRIYNHLITQSAHFHANRFGGSLVSQTNKFVGAYMRLADTFIFQVTVLVLAFIFTVIILLPKAPIFVAALLIFSIIYIATAFFVTKPVRELNAAEASKISTQTGYLADGITNVMAIKSFAAEQFEQTRFAKATQDVVDAAGNTMRATIKRDTIFGTVNGSITAIALVIASASVVLWNADIATVFLIVTYTGNITRNLWEFSTSTLRNYNRAIGDARDMTKILQLETDVKDPENPKQVAISKGEIVFKNVGFTHADAKDEDALFTDFSLHIKPGERIGLVGHSGSGKTTLTRILLRFSDINKGEILIDGQNIAHVRQSDLRANIAYVPQEPLLFHRSLRENIAYGKPDATDAEVTEAAKKAHALEFIEKLPTGFDTLVGERGVKLSGGQRQRIVIARAILKNAPIIVLDEATSALDSESERLIQQALGDLMKDRTSIVIAHRLSTIQKMDRIVVLEDGKVIEDGSHKDLLAKNGTYASLWKHQSGGFIEE